MSILLLSAWFLSFIGTRLAISLLTCYGVVDNPNRRSNHHKATPRGGGIALVVSSLFFLAVYGIDYRLIIAAAVLAGISFIDDMGGLSIRIRLVAQLGAVVIALPALHGTILPDYVPAALEYAIIIPGWLWFINLTNFMDGIDGITSLQVIMMAIGICLVEAVTPGLPVSLAVHASIIAAATLGFFWFNRHPARIFMGDTGSVTLGFLMGYLLIMLAENGSFYAAAILPAYYMGDSGFTLAKRALQGKKIWQAHSEHAYQQAVRRGSSHTAVVRKITLFNMVLIGLALLAACYPASGLAAMITAYAMTIVFIRKM